MVEFVLTGIPMIFIWISVVQMSIGMWHYHTLQYAVKAAGAFIAHRGASYTTAGGASTKIQDAAAVLGTAAIGIPDTDIAVTWTAGASSVTCQLNACKTNTTVWPPTTANTTGTDITIRADWVFNSAISMVAPGPGNGVVKFGSFHLPGYTRQFILF